MRPTSDNSRLSRELPLATKILKRGFDILFSFLFLTTVFPVTCLLLAPFFLFDRKNRGGMFFVQNRTGYRGKTFKCIKFRTMRLNRNAHLTQASHNDIRITRIGHFLRKTSIDEFPQFINVLMGDMSVVGPRPHMIRHTHMYSRLIPHYTERLIVRPGITGYAQMRGFTGPTPRLQDMENRVCADIEYIRQHTIYLDILIVMQTVNKILSGNLNSRRRTLIGCAMMLFST